MTDEEHEKEAMVLFVTGILDSERQKGRQLERDAIWNLVKTRIDQKVEYTSPTRALLELAQDIERRNGT